MPTLDDCLALISCARASAKEPESAYALRTRLKRTLLSAGQLVAEYAGVAGPLMPEDVQQVHIENQELSEILTICASLLGTSRALCQPSEALDSRWRSGWIAVCQDLDLLEQRLLSLRTSQRLGLNTTTPFT